MTYRNTNMTKNLTAAFLSLAMFGFVGTLTAAAAEKDTDTVCAVTELSEKEDTAQLYSKDEKICTALIGTTAAVGIYKAYTGSRTPDKE